VTVKRNRKPEKRKQSERPQLEDDLQDLMAALAQNAVDEGLVATLKMPWRSGWNAVRFGLAVWGPFYAAERAMHVNLSTLMFDLFTTKRREPSPQDYWDLEEALMHDEHARQLPVLRATLRCAQIMTTKDGSGDGSIFNFVWERPLERLVQNCSTTALAMIESHMKDARCFDSIGVGVQLRNDTHDYYRRAFDIAWSRRLYGAAYALPRCS